MTHSEQHRMIQELKDYEHKMSGREQEEFSMFVKRDKDDEYLDELSIKKLIDLHARYAVKKRPPV